MRLSDGPAAVLSTIVVAGLAVGVGFGVHAIIAETDDEVSPSANLAASPSPSSPSNAALGDDFCVLMKDMTFLMAELESDTSGFDIFGTGSSEAEALDALHEFGQSFIDLTGSIGDHLSRGAELVTDPGIAAVFARLADGVEGIGEALGSTALEADSLDDYMVAVFALYGDSEYSALADSAAAAWPIVDEYVLEECGIDVSGNEGHPAESPEKTDASFLGAQIEAYYLDWSEGDPHPVISVTGGAYYLNGVLLGAQTPGATLTDQSAEGPEDWCVEVSSDDNAYDVYVFTWDASGWGRCGGLIEGDIADLLPEASRPPFPSPGD